VRRRRIRAEPRGVRRHAPVEPEQGSPQRLASVLARLPPVVKAKELLEQQGRWLALRADLEAFFERVDTSAGDGVEYAAEYLGVLGRKGG
jgi:hypothetical protein